MARKKTTQNNGNSANLGFETTLWAAADKMRNNMDAAEYKHVVLGLIFLKYISDRFEEHRQYLEKETADPRSDLYVREPKARYGVLEDRDEYRAENVFWVPKDARWTHFQAKAKQATIGKLIDRVHRELTEEEIARIAGTYHAWRGDKGAGKYEDIPGFCKGVTKEEIAEHGYVLTPGRYVGAEAVEDDDEPFEEKMRRLTARLGEQFAEGARLEEAIRVNLKSLGFPV
jgi:type I restriction-modification system DNA methylase subunit